MPSATSPVDLQDGDQSIVRKPAGAHSEDTKARGRFVAACGKYKMLQTIYNKGQNDRKTSRSTLRKTHMSIKLLIEKYGVSETRFLAEKIFETLPRQIRDTIYGFVWDTKTAKEAFYSVHSPALSDTPWLVRCPHIPCQCFRVDELPFFMQRQIVGMEMARELAAAYYASIPPDRLGHDIARLDDFLLQDHFHIGIVPAEHMRHLRIEISPLKCKKLSTVYNDKIEISNAGHEIIGTALQYLDRVQHKVGFRLTIVFGPGVSGASTEDTMEKFREVCEKLTKEGVLFRVYGRASKAHFPILRVDRYFTMDREKYYDFITEQLAVKGEFDEEHSDDEEESDRSFLFDATVPKLKKEIEG